MVPRAGCDQPKPTPALNDSEPSTAQQPSDRAVSRATGSNTMSQGKRKKDQINFVGLEPAEGRGDRVITALGLPYVKLDAPCYVV